MNPTPLLEKLLEATADCSEPREFLDQVFGGLCARLGVDAAVLALFERGQWRRDTSCGEHTVLPYELLADALDAERTLVRDGWVAAPLARATGVSAVLAVRSDSPPCDRIGTADHAALDRSGRRVERGQRAGASAPSRRASGTPAGDLRPVGTDAGDGQVARADGGSVDPFARCGTSQRVSVGSPDEDVGRPSRVGCRRRGTPHSRGLGDCRTSDSHGPTAPRRPRVRATGD